MQVLYMKGERGVKTKDWNANAIARRRRPGAAVSEGNMTSLDGIQVRNGGSMVDEEAMYEGKKLGNGGRQI